MSECVCRPDVCVCGGIPGWARAEGRPSVRLSGEAAGKEDQAERQVGLFISRAALGEAWWLRRACDT